MSPTGASAHNHTERDFTTMTARPAHTEKILRDDIRWLESRIAALDAADAACERRLARCYETLLDQRRRQLATLDGGCPGCWQDYFR